MRLDDYDDDNGAGLPIIYTVLGVSAFILVVLGIVVAVNGNKKPKNTVVSNYTVTEAVAEAVPTNEERKIVAGDLDIWDMYPEEPPVKKDTVATDVVKPTVAVSPSPTAEPDYNDGKHVEIVYEDGSTEWVKINDKIEKNNYDYTNLVDSGGKLKYVTDGRKISFLGIDVSRYQKEIDFSQIKDQGIDFVMIRVGARGYKTGNITMDECFEQNLNNAIEAGMDVGVYFYSQAINVAEAEEEANMVINALGERKITYPIAFDMEYVSNDTARIDTLTKDEKTLITSAFVNKIKEAGFRPMIYGNKEWLLKRIDVSKFDQSSIWLAQEDEKPDYPYMFDMWQYTTEGSLYGIEGSVDMNICFVDYHAQ